MQQGDEKMSKNDNIYWRYKKATPPVEENADKNGEVKVVKPAERKSTLPSPFKCSKCDYVAPNNQAIRQHWLDH